ncbi:MAG: ubiquitin carboxyl-terminal hydrolase [Alphaproteobacteria bacterium]|nr:ubiquitin carboxyl-terminal hydrolase [Alphaproteobacteria bacterium]
MKITLKIFTLLCVALIASNGYSMHQVFNNNHNMMINNTNIAENNDQQKMKQAMINIVTDPFRKHAGLQNIGATCYMNATIQAIASNPKFCFYFLKNAYENYNNLLQNNKEGWLTIQFANVIAELWSNTTWYAPYAFKKILGMVNPLFLGVAANDSKDLLLCFYENMHSALNTPTNNVVMQSNNRTYAEFCNNYFSKNQSLILDQFYFIQSSHMVCNECKFDIDNYSTYNMLIFPLEKVRLMKANNNDTTPVTIMDCFKLNENQETFVGANQIYCNNCRKMADATTYNKLDYSPNILSIILNRGKGLQYDVDVNIEDKLDLSDYVTQFKNDSKYFLSAIVCHLGESGMGGHFVTISRPSPDKPWVLYNDAQVTEYTNEYKQKKNINKILQGKFTPYILFYAKNKYDAKAILNNKQAYMKQINNMKIKSMMPSNMMMPGMWNNMGNNMMWSNMMWNNMNMMNNMNRNMMLNNMNMNMGMNMVNNNMQKFNNFNNPKMNNFNNNNMGKGINMHNNIAMNNHFNMNNNMQQNNCHQNMMRNNMNQNINNFNNNMMGIKN